MRITGLPMQQDAHANDNRFVAIFSALGSARKLPLVEHGPVGQILDELHVQNKTTTKRYRRMGYRVHLYRHAGRFAGKDTRKPYNGREFDLLVVYIVEEQKLVAVFVFPMPVLAAHGYVSSRLSVKNFLYASLPSLVAALEA